MQAPTLVDGISVIESVANATYTINVQDAERIALYTVAADGTPGAKSFVAANVKTNVQTPASSIAITGHGFVTGLKVALSGTNLPTGLSATNYWVIVIDANTISLASSLANANAGTKVSITGAGTTADAALTPAGLGSSTVDLKVSFDGTNYMAFATPKTITITTAGKQWLDCGTVNFPYVQIAFTAPLAGALTLDAYVYICKAQHLAE